MLTFPRLSSALPLRVLAVFVTMIASGSMHSTFTSVVAEEAATAPSGAGEVRQRIEQLQQERQGVEKDVSLRKAAVDVAIARVQDLQKQLQEASTRAENEQKAFELLQQKSQAVEQQSALLAEELKKHESADAAQMIASAAAARLDELIAARKQLETQLAGLRKQSVEWQSKAVESDQQIKALEAQKPEIQKSVTDTKTAADTAAQQLTVANDAMAAAEQVLAKKMAEHAAEQQRVDAAAAASTKFTDSLAALQKSLADLKAAAAETGVSPDDAVNGLVASITSLEPLQKNTTALVQQLTERRDALQPQLDAAKAEAQKKQAEQLAASEASKKASSAHQQAAEKLAAVEPQQNTLKTVMTDAQSRQQALAAQISGLEPSIQKLTAEVQLVRTETVAQQKLAEAALEPLGRFVSFSRHVAPILAKHCVACHNTRSPGGRLNLDSFAALNKGGESGPVLLAHKSSESLLLTMVEDGSMPKDTEPLSDEEKSMIRSWISVGAPLDAGLTASAELFDVMPETSQPLPPSNYRVAIPITATAFSPDGTLLASSGYHEVLLWNAADGTLIRRIANVAERVYDVEFTQDGKQLAVAAGTPGQLGEVKIFSAADGTLMHTLVRAKDAVFALSYSPDGNQLACGGADRSISVVSTVATENTPVGHVITKIEDHADWVMDVNWSPDGTRLVSSSRDKTSKVFDAKTGDPVITFSGHGEPVYSAAFLADGKSVVSGGGDKKLHIWNTADAKEIRAMAGYGGDIFRVLVVAGDRIFSASADRSVREHNAADGQLIRTFSGHGDWVYTVSLNAVRNVIASGSYDGEIRVWNSQDGSVQSSFKGMPNGPAAGSNVTASTR